MRRGGSEWTKIDGGEWRMGRLVGDSGVTIEDGVMDLESEFQSRSWDLGRIV